MTAEEIRRENYNKWQQKKEFRKKLMKCYPDLGEICEMRYGINVLIKDAKNRIDTLMKEDVAADDDELVGIKWDKRYLEKVFNHLDKEAKELFERYGVEDKCSES